YRVLNDDLEMIEEITVEAPYWADIHDFEILSNGNYLMGFLRDTIMDLSAYTFNGVQGSATTTVLFLALREFDSNLNVVWEWRAIDHISIDEFYDFFSYNPDGMDFTHFNALAETTDGSGDILVSFRHLNAIHRVSRTTGNIVWRLGGAFSCFCKSIKMGKIHPIRIVGKEI
ncbi:MAG: arylsulfotransferase family protein, partial [Bacteroidota bacterium]